MSVSRVGVIVVDDLHKAYGDRPVLEGVTFDVRAGEVFALLGPNGAGKTTTVEILEGYRTATSGHVRVLGIDPATHARSLRERVGIVLQECGFPGHLRVGELVDAWRGYYPAPLATDALLDVVELSDERRTFVRRLSGGQRRRLDFALALAGDPDLIFLDEPTTGFDPEARRRCWTAVENLCTLGKTVVLTTHYLDEAERLADRVAILNDGVIRTIGTPTELASRTGAPSSISFTHSGARIVVHAQHVSARLRELFDEYGELENLAVTRPTLEDVYMELATR